MSTSLGQTLDQVKNAINAGNADALSTYMDSSIELGIDGDEGVLQKAQAVTTLKRFFATNPPISFIEVHKGASKSKGGKYMIGDLETKQDKFYRVYIYTEYINGKYLIKQLRFDEE